MIIEANKNIPELRNLKESDIEPKIFEYLRAIRQSFSRVVITNSFGMATKNGRTTKQDCYGTFHPKAAAVIELNEMVCLQLTSHAQSIKLMKWSAVFPYADSCRILIGRDSETNRRHFRYLHFRLSVTMAHELVHIYNLFLRRGRFDHTPPHVSYGPYEDDQAGEFGRYWEHLVFGGFLDMRDTSEDPANRMEAIAIRDSHGQRVWRLKTAVIDGILERDFRRWLEPGMPLNDPEHPKGLFTEVIQPHHWTSRFCNMFPAPREGERGLQLSPAHIAWLTGKAAPRSPSHDMSGQDLRLFTVRPMPVLRHAVKW
jgi:hypothetical protein